MFLYWKCSKPKTRKKAWSLTVSLKQQKSKKTKYGNKKIKNKKGDFVWRQKTSALKSNKEWISSTVIR